MATAGVWMLVGVAALMIATGLPAWMMLIAIALAFSSAGVAVGAVPLPLAFPALVWRGPTFEPAAGESGRPLSDDEAGALFRRQLEENDAEPLPNDGKKQ